MLKQMTQEFNIKNSLCNALKTISRNMAIWMGILLVAISISTFATETQPNVYEDMFSHGISSGVILMNMAVAAIGMCGAILLAKSL